MKLCEAAISYTAFEVEHPFLPQIPLVLMCFFFAGFCSWSASASSIAPSKCILPSQSTIFTVDRKILLWICVYISNILILLGILPVCSLPTVLSSAFPKNETRKGRGVMDAFGSLLHCHCAAAADEKNTVSFFPFSLVAVPGKELQKTCGFCS